MLYPADQSIGPSRLALYNWRTESGERQPENFPTYVSICIVAKKMLDVYGLIDVMCH